MTQIRVRLCDADRARYKTDDELTFDSEKLKDLEAGELDALERDMDAAIASLLPLIEPRLGKLSLARRAVAYLAVRQAGSPVTWDDFQPKLLRAEFVEVADSDPPAGSSESSSETAASPAS